MVVKNDQGAKMSSNSLKRKQFHSLSFKFNTFIVEGLDKVGKTTFLDSLFPEVPRVSMFNGRIATIKEKSVVFCKFPCFTSQPLPEKPDSVEAINFYLNDFQRFIKTVLTMAPIWDPDIALQSKSLLLICDRSPLSTLVYNLPTSIGNPSLRKIILNFAGVFSEFFEGDNIIYYIEPPKGYPNHFSGKTDDLDKYNFERASKLKLRYEDVLRNLDMTRTKVLYSSKLNCTQEDFAKLIDTWSSQSLFVEKFYDKIVKNTEVYDFINEAESL